MPVRITQKSEGPRCHYDLAVEALAPVIKNLRSEGIHDIRRLADRLNDDGFWAPSGRKFSYGAMRRTLQRLNELHLGPGPRSLSSAASQRPPRPYKPPRRKPKPSRNIALVNALMAAAEIRPGASHKDPADV